MLKRIIKKSFYTKKEGYVLTNLLKQNFLNFGFEPTSACNASCSFCVYRLRDKKIVPNENIKFEYFKKGIDEYDAMGGGYLGITPTDGEIFMNPQIIEIIKYARTKKNIKEISTYTNAVDFRGHTSKEIIASGLSKISISTTIGDNEMYKRLYGIDKYSQMYQNVIDLLKENNKQQNKVNILIALRHDDNFDVERTKDYQNLLKYINKENITNLPNNRGYENWGGKIKKNDLPFGASFRPVNVDKTLPCSELYRKPYLLTNGNINVCPCNDYQRELVIGNINEQSLQEIWNNGKLDKLRNDWKEKEVLPNICKQCTSYQSIDDYVRDNRIDIWRTNIRRLIKRK